MDDFGLILLALAAIIALPAMTIAAFVMVLGLRSRVAYLERRVRALVAAAEQAPPVAAPASSPPPEPPDEEAPSVAAPETVAPSPEPEPEPELEIGPEVEPVAARGAEPEPSDDRPAPSTPARASLEETIGARWAVWVGGLALALGGIFLVRYSIEAGLVGPGTRIVLGLLFSLALVAAGEVLRRRGTVSAAAQAAYIPGIVTAAGTAALFATIYSAYALYGFVGPAFAFVALGVVGVLTMFAAALHGPALAGLGLVGSYGTPLLVSSSEPNPFALVAFLFAVTAAAFALARLRLWRWLALAAGVASLLWGLPVAMLSFGGSLAPMVAHILLLGALMLAALVVEPHRGKSADGFDGLALALLAGLAALALFFAEGAMMAHPALATALIVAAALLAAGLVFPAVSPAACIAALLCLGLALVWPIASQVAAEPRLVAPDLPSFPPTTPDALSLYLAVAAITGAALVLATTARLMRPPPLPGPAEIALALAGTAGPLAILAISYVRTTNLTASVPFGVIALGAAALYAATTARLSRSADARFDAGALHAAGSAAALALALAMVLDGSRLTLAFALAALGIAWVERARGLPALRWCAAALAVLVLLRSGSTWAVLGFDYMHFPDWTELALRFLLPAAAFGVAAHVLRSRAADTPAAIVDGAALVLGTLTGSFAIRLWINGTVEAGGAPLGMAEAGLQATLLLAIAAGLAFNARRTMSEVHRYAAPIFAVLAIAAAVVGPLALENPLVTGDAIVGGAVVNALLAGFLLPAVLAALGSVAWSGLAAANLPHPMLGRAEAHGLSLALGALAVALAFFYLTFETKLLVSGPDMDFWSIPPGESYAYSAVWLLFGIALLAGGLAFGSKGARLASAAIITLTVAKVFLLDMSGLEGVWRALSFIGLGLALIGIGLVYQRLLFGRTPAIAERAE